MTVTSTSGSTIPTPGSTVPDLGVIGLGYVGVPLAVAASRAGLRTVGFDIDADRVAALNAIVAGTPARLDVLDPTAASALSGAGFRADTASRVLTGARVFVICVPTPLSPAGRTDLTAVEAAAREIASLLEPGCLVVLESTPTPGTTEELLVPILEGGSGLRAGVDFHVVFSPERVDPGNPAYGIGNTPRVVGGLTPACSLAAAAFYERFVPKVEIVSSPRTAEFAKLLENTYRLVNIALVNEVAALCSQVGVDPWEVVRAAATKPFGFAPFWPGPGVGGHCIPVDPVYLNEYATRQTGRPLPILDTALATVRALPERVADKAIAAIGLDGAAGARVLLLGVTYKPNVADTRETPAAPLARHLVARGVRVAFHDPLVRRWDFGDGPVQSVDDAALPGAVRDAALVILLQPHAAYRLPTLLAEAKQVLDTRGVLAPSRGVMRL